MAGSSTAKKHTTTATPNGHATAAGKPKVLETTPSAAKPALATPATPTCDVHAAWSISTTIKVALVLVFCAFAVQVTLDPPFRPVDFNLEAYDLLPATAPRVHGVALQVR